MSYEKKYQPYSYSKERNANNTPYTLAQNETLLECPYDKNHKVLDTRAAAHFLNCYRQHVKRRNEAHLPTEFKICDYSRLHHIRVECYKNHLLTCPARKEMVEQEYEFDASVVPKFNLEPAPRVEKPIKKEYNNSKWDFDQDVADDANLDSDLDNDEAKEDDEGEWQVRNPRRKYDFKLREKQMGHLRQPIGLTKSEKKERMEKICEDRGPNLKTDDDDWE